MDYKARAKAYLKKYVTIDGNQRGFIKWVAFTNKDWSTCFYMFKSDRGGEFLVSIDRITEGEKQLTLF